ncbi:hypothetical protein [uncultured Brachyspira sp.]|uniref:hypothetical protein n=1 Tax=uncultured Brachyspira sp. TaxID=221953 RepID=UPI0026397950|nr:hypothetical protein [uncultured Brachyspira sp.]
MLKAIYISIISLFLLSCRGVPYHHLRGFDGPPPPMPGGPAFFDHFFGIHGILNIIIKILIIVVLVFAIKYIYDKNKNNKKE